MRYMNFFFAAIPAVILSACNEESNDVDMCIQEIARLEGERDSFIKSQRAEIEKMRAASAEAPDVTDSPSVKVNEAMMDFTMAVEQYNNRIASEQSRCGKGAGRAENTGSEMQ